MREARFLSVREKLTLDGGETLGSDGSAGFTDSSAETITGTTDGGGVRL